MLGLRVTICRYVDDGQPGWVDCRLTDAGGREWSFIEKVPVVSAEALDASSQYPRSGVIGCRVLERRSEAGGDALVVVDTAWPWDIQATSGETRFEVAPEQLVEIDDHLHTG